MSDRLNVATSKGLFRLARNGRDWSVVDTAFLGAGVSMTLHDARDGNTYAALKHGHFGVKFHRSSTNGDGKWQWEETTAPAYPEKPADAPEVKCPMRGIEIPWNVEMIWSLETGAEEGELWCGTIPGGLFHSTDCGATWRLVEPLWMMDDRAKWMGGGYDYPGIHSICVDPRDQKKITIAISCGGNWQTADNGETWAVKAKGLRADYAPPGMEYEQGTQDAHRLVQCAADPDKMWIQHHNGIFRSIDGSENWTEIENAKPSAFGFGVAVHPHDGDIAWFVPAVKDEMRIPADGQLVVSRTRDGGQTFDVLREGLPQQDAYDIAYRHCLVVDETGDRVAFGTTTGSLFVSDDQGDTWQCINANLPPIWSVRFE